MKNDMKKCIDCGVPLVKKSSWFSRCSLRSQIFRVILVLCPVALAGDWLGVEPQTHLYAVNSCF